MVVKQKILVTGADGQLGKAIKEIASSFRVFDFIFTTRKELPLDDVAVLAAQVNYFQPQYIINCAAYTAVDKAESEKETAYAINADAAAVLAKYCTENNARLLHISTDYVFDGNASVPYKEDAVTNPVTVYGNSKLKGEQLIQEYNRDAIIIRTAWVYAAWGKNFVNTMLRLMKEKEQVSVVNDQVGSPTYAVDLANAVMYIIASQNWQPGIYHFSNEGEISWFDFAVAIKELSRSQCSVNPIKSDAYPTPAKRPAYSVLDKTKIRQVYQLGIKDWKESLAACISRIKNPENNPGLT